MNFLEIEKMSLKNRIIEVNRGVKFMIKAIFVDIDGTLRDSNRNLSAKTIETIRKVTEKGILVILFKYSEYFVIKFTVLFFTNLPSITSM